MTKVWIYVYVLLLCIACRVGVYQANLPITEGEPTLLSKGLEHFLFTEWSGYIAGVLGVVACAFLSLLLSRQIFRMSEQSALPWVMCILLLSTQDSFIPFSPGAFGALCLVFLFYFLLGTCQQRNCIKETFFCGLVLGAGSFLWGYLLWFLPLLWVMLHRFGALTEKTFAASFLGMASLYWVAWGGCLMSMDYRFLSEPVGAVLGVQPLAVCGLGWVEGGSMGVCVLVFFLSVGFTLRRRLREERHIRRIYRLLLHFAYFVLFLVALYPVSAAKELFLIFCVPASVFIADLYTKNKRRWVLGMFHVMVFSIAFFVLFRIAEGWRFL
ncbi:MAG: hypothetical protein LBT73_00835 [Tannerellaceae bacterium]|nr:hypothetical protein [Tannerellaceae bacterium]